MRAVRTSVMGLLVACAVAAGPVAALAAPADERPPTTPGRSGDASEGDRARAALESVDDAFRGAPASARRVAPGAHSGRQLTLLLRELRLRLDGLEGEERDRAESYLARPDGVREFDLEPLYGEGANPTDDCTVAPIPGSNVCVHWATGTADAPPLADADGDRVPDHVETTRDVLNRVWKAVVTDGGYRAPLSDAESANHGPDGKLDVYLADVGADRLYGYCTTDDPDWQSTTAVSAYCVLDDDFATSQFRGVPLENLQVTAAHEFFHAVQYAYDWTEDSWLLEGTAAWVEDELYDDVDDNRQYLTLSPLSNPEMPLDYGSTYYNPYASWIFWRYLTERFPAHGGTGMPLLVREVLERSAGATPADSGAYSTQALTRTIDTPLPKLFTEFAVANRHPAATYDEGAEYPVAPAARMVTLTNGKGKSVSTRPFHLATDTTRVLPGRQLKGTRWKLRVAVDMPTRSYGYAAAVTVVGRTGKVTTKHVQLSAQGNATVTTAFGRKRVKSVELTLVNASVRYDCWDALDYACQGTPKDDQRTLKASVKAFR